MRRSSSDAALTSQHVEHQSQCATNLHPKLQSQAIPSTEVELTSPPSSSAAVSFLREAAFTLIQADADVDQVGNLASGVAA